MLVVVAAAAALLIIVIIVMVVVMLMVVAAAGTLIIVIVVMMVMMPIMFLLLGKLLQRSSKGVSTLHRSQKLLPVQLVPRSRYNGSRWIFLPQQCYTGIQLFPAHTGSPAQNNGAGVLHLIIEKLAKVFHIHLGFGSVHHSGKAVQHHIVHFQVLHRTDHIAQLAHAGGLDQNAVGVIGLHHLLQRLAEIAHQAAADAAAVHFGNVNTRFLQKTTVNADFTKLIFNEDKLFAGISLSDQLLDECRLACAQKTRENINFSHKSIFFP